MVNGFRSATNITHAQIKICLTWGKGFLISILQCYDIIVVVNLYSTKLFSNCCLLFIFTIIIC